MNQQQFLPAMMPPFAQPQHIEQESVRPLSKVANRSNGAPSKHHLEELRKRKRDLEKKFRYRSPRQVDLFPSFAQTSCSSLNANKDDDKHDAVTPRKPLPPQMAEWWSSSSSASSSEHSRGESSTTSTEKRSEPSKTFEISPKQNQKSFETQPSLWDDEESMASKMKLLWR